MSKESELKIIDLEANLQIAKQDLKETRIMLKEAETKYNALYELHIHIVGNLFTQVLEELKNGNND